MARHLLRMFAGLLLLSALPQAQAASPAVERWADEFEPSSETRAFRVKELSWFAEKGKAYAGKTITVVAEDIPTHFWERDVLAKAFEEITGIKVQYDVIGEGAVVENIFKQMSQGTHLYDIYVNDADNVGTHTRLKSVVNLSEYMRGEGKTITNPYLDLPDFLNLEFGQDYDGNQLQLPDQQFANLYWFRHDWFSRPDLREQFRAFTAKKYGAANAYDLDVPVNWAAYEDIAEFFTHTKVDGAQTYGHVDFGKKSPSLGWRFTDAWLSIAGAGDKGLPNGLPVDEWGIRVENRIPVGSSVTRGGATNGPAAVYALQTYIDWLQNYAPPAARQGTFSDNNIEAAKGHVAQQIFLYTLWLSQPEYNKGNMLGKDGLPVWRVAPTPHGKYWEEGMKAGYQDAGSWTIPLDTKGPRRAAAWLFAQFCVSKTVSVQKFLKGMTPIRKSTLHAAYIQENKARWGGLIDFYTSSGAKLWTGSGLNVPHYPLLFRIWWDNLDKAINGQLTAQQAMDAIARGQDDLMAQMHMAQYSPKLNPEKPPAYWLNRPGAPKAPREREKPMTIPYEKIMQRWAETQIK